MRTITQITGKIVQIIMRILPIASKKDNIFSIMRILPNLLSHTFAKNFIFLQNRLMKIIMSIAIRKKLKIFYSVIIPNFIFMMNYFHWKQMPTKMFFHYKDLLLNSYRHYLPPYGKLLLNNLLERFGFLY